MIFPSAYCGNIAYFKHLSQTKVARVDLHEKFQKQTFRSRCTILGANGKQTLSIPLIRPEGKNTMFKDVMISDAENWRKDHLKAIESAYARTPYYEFYIDSLLEIFSTKYNALYKFNHALTLFFLAKLDLEVEITFSETSMELEENDLRINFNEKMNDRLEVQPYIQPFEDKHGFIANLSVLDLLFCEGPNSITLLNESTFTNPL